MKEQWRVIHIPFPHYNDGCYLAPSHRTAVDIAWKLYAEAMRHGCRRPCIQRIQKLVGNEWINVNELPDFNKGDGKQEA